MVQLYLPSNQKLNLSPQRIRIIKISLSIIVGTLAYRCWYRRLGKLGPTELDGT
jgi:hypothetical protein